MKKLSGNLILENQLVEGEIHFDQKIQDIKIKSHNPAPKATLILPGFIDLHVHGGGGVDVMDEQDLTKILRTHAQYGTSSLLLTTVTAPQEQLVKVFKKIENKKKNQKPNESRILGVHLEGPYISPDKLGAQPEHTRTLDIEEIKALHAISPIQVITLAPEMITKNYYAELKALGIIVQLGHSNGSYEQGHEALKLGAKSFTHLFNAMSGFHHRSPGIVGAALAHAEYAELIPDLLHVHPGAIKAALRAIPKLYFVTDSTAATGMPDGDFKLGEHTVSKCGHGVRLADGTLAGSCLTGLQALQNLLGEKIGLSYVEAARRLSTIQSEFLGLSEQRGRLHVGSYADIIEINPQGELLSHHIEGEKLGL